MKLSDFIRANQEEILTEWENFAATLGPLEDANKVELRDHAAALLGVIALDIDTDQAERQSIAKSHGLGPRATADTAAEIHAADRVAAGLTGDQVMAEFRALRSSVLRIWARKTDVASAEDFADMVRFNEAIDQALSESMTRYSDMLREAQNLFLAILGHDVRSPLGAISMGAQVILHDQDMPSKAVKVGQRIFNSAKRMDEIVRDLLDFSTTHLGDGIPIDPKPVDLRALSANVVDEARTLHPERDIYFETAGPLSGSWDGARMAQAFANLISNAVQHGRAGAPIKVSLKGSADQVAFTVQNDADVIPAPKLRTFFDPVRRFAIRPASERSTSGTANLGLGLYVVKQIVRSHGGTIGVASSATQGVTFTILLPGQSGKAVTE